MVILNNQSDKYASIKDALKLFNEFKNNKK